MIAASWRRGRFLALALGGGAYVLLAHLLTAREQPSSLGALIALLPITLVALAMAWRSPSRRLALALWTTWALGVALAWPLLESRFVWISFLQHLGIFLLLTIGFARSLAAGEVPIVTRFAHAVHGPRLAPEVVRYTRGVTLAWTLFFAAMSVASATLFGYGSVASWSVLANLLTPLLVGLMFAIEFAVRLTVLPDTVRTGLVDSIRACMSTGPRPDRTGT